MSAPITLSPFDGGVQAELRRRYDTTSNLETRTRYQMILLAKLGSTAPQIAHIFMSSTRVVATPIGSTNM